MKYGDVYMHPQILTLGLKLLPSKFIRRILTYYKIAPSLLSGVAWHTVLGFEARCALIVPNSCQREVFSAAFVLRKTAQDARYFVPQTGCEKIIVNIVDSDHGMRNTMVWLTGAWEAESENEHGVIPTAWNLGRVAWKVQCRTLISI